MYDFNSNNKLPGVYWLKQPIDDLKLKYVFFKNWAKELREHRNK